MFAVISIFAIHPGVGGIFLVLFGILYAGFRFIPTHITVLTSASLKLIPRRDWTPMTKDVKTIPIEDIAHFEIQTSNEGITAQSYSYAFGGYQTFMVAALKDGSKIKFPVPTNILQSTFDKFSGRLQKLQTQGSGQENFKSNN